jgi:hypothetical protein
MRSAFRALRIVTLSGTPPSVRSEQGDGRADEDEMSHEECKGGEEEAMHGWAFLVVSSP